MAIIPTDAALGNLPSMRSGAQIVSIDDPGRVGRAIAGLGEAMEGAAAQLAQSWEQNSGLEDEAKFQAFQNERMLEIQKLQEDTAPEMAKGATLGYINDKYKPAAKQFLDAISPKNRAAYTSKLINLQGQTTQSVYEFEKTAQSTASTNIVKDTLTSSFLVAASRAASVNVDDPASLASLAKPGETLTPEAGRVRKAAALQDTLSQFHQMIDTLPYNVSATQREDLRRQYDIAIKKQFLDSLPDSEKVLAGTAYGFKPSDLVTRQEIQSSSPIAVGTDKGQVVIPTIVNGRKLSDSEAFAEYQRTGKALGVFSDVKSADAFIRGSGQTAAPATGAGGGFLVRGKNLPPAIGSAIDAAAAAYGLDPALMRAIAAIESSGNPRAQTGSNKGLFQLSNDIFSKYGKGGDIFDPVANATAAAAELADFQRGFTAKHGRAATAGEIYLYHQQGVAGAPALLANPTKVAWQAVRQFYSSDAVAKSAIWGNIADTDKAQFGSVENVTAEAFTNYWKQKVEGGGNFSQPSVPYNLSGINPEYTLKVADTAQRQLEIDYKNKLQADRLDMNQAIDDERGRVELAIHDHRPVNVDADIRNNPLFSDKIKAELINTYESENSKQIEQQRVIDKFTNPSNNINGFSNEDKADANKFYDAIGGADGLDKLDEKATGKLYNFLNSYGIIPKSAVDAIVAGLNAQSEETRGANLAFVNGLYRKNRVAFERDFPESAVKMAHAYEDLTKNTPMPEVVRLLDPRADRATLAAREESSRQAETVFKSITTSSIIDSGWDTAFTSQPNDPMVGGVLNQFRREFGEAFAQGWNISPNKDFAMNYAIRNTKQKWDGSNAGSKWEFMAYPPEKNYPTVGNSHDWMKAQLKARMDKEFPEYQDYHLVATTNTEATLGKTSKTPTPQQLADPGFPKGTVYDVVVIGKSGEYGLLKNFWFDPVPAQEAERAEFARRNALDAENQAAKQRVLQDLNQSRINAPPPGVKDNPYPPGIQFPLNDGLNVPDYEGIPMGFPRPSLTPRQTPAAPANEVVPERFRTIEPSVSPMRRNTPTSPAAGFPRIGG